MSMMSKIRDLPGWNVVVLPWHLLQAVLAGVRYGWPARGEVVESRGGADESGRRGSKTGRKAERMTIIGVTGTNGKTTTSFMIWKMLNQAGRKTGLMTTVAWGGVPGLPEKTDEDNLVVQVEHMTTVDSFTLNKRIEEIREAGAECLVLEVTSHAMAQFRTLGVPIDIAVMTNVTHEHLDYHGTLEKYRDAKRKLFKKAEYGVVNLDDPSGEKFIESMARRGDKGGYGCKSGECRDGEKNYTTYGINEKADLRATGVKLGASGVEYACDELKSGAKKGMKARGERVLKIRTQIPGKFNVYNSLAAVAVGRKLGLSDEEISEGIFALSSVEGRMNRVDLGQDFEVIVDFAHTPDAFLKVFESVCPHKGGRVISLFGGAGRRDESTRAERGEIAGKYSDVVIVTEDDSRDEKPAEIAEMFVQGAKKAGLEEVIVELDREKAIFRAITEAKKGDLVLILGKGHEKTILRAGGPEPFEDLKVTRAAIEKRLRKK